MRRTRGTLVIALLASVTGTGLVPSVGAATDPVMCFREAATLVGTDGDDVIRGTAGDDVIAGLDGNDLILGLEGDDIICGDGGSDVLRGGLDSDRLVGGTNASTTDGDPIPEDLWGGAGGDVIDGADLGLKDDPTSVDRVHFDNAPRSMLVDLSDPPYGDATGEGDDLLLNVEVVFGGAFDDVMYGRGAVSEDIAPANTRNDDKFFGLGGDDYLLGRGGRDVLNGGNGTDRLVGGLDNDGLHGGSGTDDIAGGLGEDLANGDDGNDVVAGDEGRDNLDGGAGDDRVLGGDDWDILSDPSGTDVADAGPDDAWCSRSFETRINCRFLFTEPPGERTAKPIDRDSAQRHGTRATAQGDVTPTCQGEPATIVGTNGPDDIVGTSGRDVISAGRHVDHINGGGGDDLICAGNGGDRLRGGGGDDQLFGGRDGYHAGDERPIGDQLWGGSGDDQFSVGYRAAPNVVHFDDSPAPIVMRGDVVTGFGNDLLVDVRRVVGSDFDDDMVDSDRWRTLLGGPGDDMIDGQGGNDRIEGGLGNDLLKGGDGADELYGYEGSDRLEGDDGDDELWAIARDDLLLGGFGDDVLNAQYPGRGATITMQGGFGDDELYGGKGTEVVNGGWHRAGDLCRRIDEPVGCEFVRNY